MKLVDLCASLIKEEQPWDWLYLQRVAYNSHTDLIQGIWVLHDILIKGRHRHTAALSNVISLLCYLRAYDISRPREYLYCNLRGVLLREAISGALFHSTDLTRAELEINNEPGNRLLFRNTKFKSCLFDERTYLRLVMLLQNIEEEIDINCEFDDCYCERSENGKLEIVRAQDVFK